VVRYSAVYRGVSLGRSFVVTSKALTPEWTGDTLLTGFQARTLNFPNDYDGPVTATLVRRKASTPVKRAFLYIHGYIDYFFQEHFAEECNNQGYDFYALDMRKYGRSLGNSKHPNFCKDISEYYPEITAAIRIMEEEIQSPFLVLNGHSTGGLIAALYAAEGAERNKIQALFLNSPFFDFNLPPSLKRLLGPMSQIGRVAPFSSSSGGVSQLYPMSIHKAYYGEWDFDLRLKPFEGFPTYLGWIRAIKTAQARVRKGLQIACPVLVMHSDKSVYAKEWSEQILEGDAVLNVEHIREGSKHLGDNVKDVTIPNGLHDLTLSRKEARERVFSELFGWLESLQHENGSSG
jgi:alpha-beta hydrolase superfamily lysophospholipase